MAKEDKKDGKKKKKGGCLTGVIAGICALVFIIIFVVAAFFAIVEAIIRNIINTIMNIIDGIINFLTHPWKSLKVAWATLGNGWDYIWNNSDFNPNQFEEFRQEQLIVVTQENFNDMTERLDSMINRNIAGLDNIMLKKMLLTYNAGKYSKNADIVMELTPEEETQCRNDSSIYYPFELKQGKEIEQMKMDLGEKVDLWLFERGEYEEKKAAENAYYLCTNGVLTLKNDKGQELIYYPEETLQKIYEKQCKKHLEGIITASEYASAVWDYLERCYTDGIDGIKMYKDTITEVSTTWDYKDEEIWKLFGYEVANLGLSIRKEVERADRQPKTNYVEMQNIEYYTLVSKHLTPVEFMVTLLEYSESRDFLDTFIKLVAEKNNIELTVYRIETGEGLIEKETKHEKTTITGQVGGNGKVEITRRYIETVTTNEDGSTTTSYAWVDGQGELQLDAKAVDSDVNLIVAELPRVSWTITISNIPANVKKVEFYVNNQLGGRERREYAPKNGKITYTEKDYFVQDSAKKANECDITTTNLTVTTETNYTIALTKVESWYGKSTYNNEKVNTKEMYTQKYSYGGEEKIRSTKDINMFTVSNYTETVTPSSVGDPKLFYDLSSVEKIAAENWNERISSWIDKLEGDDFAFWVTGAHVGQLINYAVNGKGTDTTLASINEIRQIKAAFAASEGWLDGWFCNNYTIVEMKSDYTNVQKGYVRTLVESNLNIGPSQPSDELGSFLGLLRNTEGKILVDKNGKLSNVKYNPNGRDVMYEGLYGNKEEAVGHNLSTSIEQICELLEQYDSSRGLSDVMRYLFSAYKNNNAGYDVEEYDYSIFDPTEMVPVY